jgi:hypothetical protein
MFYESQATAWLIGHNDEQTYADMIAAKTDFALALELIGKACANFQSRLKAVRSDGERLTFDDLVADDKLLTLLDASLAGLRKVCNDYDQTCTKAFEDAAEVIENGSTITQ